MNDTLNEFSYDINSIKPDESMIVQDSNFRFTVLSERLIRLEYSTTGNFVDSKTSLVSNRKFDKPNFEIKDENRVITINTRYFKLVYYKNKPFKGGTFSPEANLKVSLNGTDKVWYYNHPEVRNFKGSAYSLDDMNNVKLNKGLYSIDGFVSLDDSNNNILATNGLAQKRVDGNLDIYLFMYGKDFGLCLSDYFKLTGNPPLLPKYSLGIWWNRDRIYNTNDVLGLVKTFKKYNIPISVILLSEFWHNKDKSNYNLHKSGYSFNKELFPDPVSLINYLHSNNIAIGLNIDPSEGISSYEPVYTNFVQKFPVDKNKKVPFEVMNEKFMKNFSQQILMKASNMTDFWWVDYNGESSSLEAFNYYLFNSLKMNSNKRPFLMSRNSNISSHKYGIQYSGETVVDFNVLNYLPSFNANSSNAGLSWWSHDVGGFKGGIEDSELYLRHVQFACFSPIFRFSSKRGPYYKREPWLWDVKTMTIVEDYCHLRYKLLPYLYSQNYNYHKKGMPLVQPLYYKTPEIYDEPNYKNEYYFGTEFLVAPITKNKNIVMNRSVERIFLPTGTWYDFKTGKKFIGDKRYVTFYKDEDYPVFVKAGAIVPLSLTDNNSLSNPVNLEINVFPGENNNFNLYEDDGISNNYKNGNYHITSFDYNYMANNYTLIIRSLEGNTSVIPQLRNYIIKFRNTKQASDVSVYSNGDKVSNKIETYFDDVNFIIKIYDVDVTKQLTINCRGTDIEIDTVRIINEDINYIITDLKITTNLKEKIAAIIFSDMTIKKKRIEIRKLRRDKLDYKFINMFINLLEYMSEI